VPFPQRYEPELLPRCWFQRDTFLVRSSAKLGFLCVAFCLSANSALGDEIRLKDGKKLYGVIVAYEDNMFKVKTDFGFVLVEKDKIASIVPTAPASATPVTTAAKPAKTAGKKQPAEAQAAAATTNVANSGAPTDASDSNVAKPKFSNEPVHPVRPETSNASKVAPPSIKSATQPANSSTLAVAPLPAPPKAPEPSAMKEQVQGTLYTNFSHGFRMYKAPSWELIEGARNALPNAIVAMGTSNESTLMVVGQEQMKDSLDISANAVEKRLREIYSNYRMISRRKTVIGGAPAIEFKYSGMAEEHDWSGTLVVVSRGKEVLTLLGMTYANNDLIQIQENVIARAISSTDFNVH
jgi:hypothetical protein